VYGFVYSGLDTGQALSPVLFGPLLDAGHFRQALFAVAVLQASGLFFALHVGSRVQAPTSLAPVATREYRIPALGRPAGEIGVK